MLARALERPIFDKGVRQRLAHDNRAMVAQHQYPLVAEMLDQPRTLFLAHGDAFKVMIGQLSHEVACVEVHRLQAALKAAHGNGCGGVRVDDRMCVGQGTMEQAVLNKACFVYVPRVIDVDLVAINIDFDEARRGNFTEMHAIRVNQKRAVRIRHFDRNVVEHKLIPAEHRKYPITGRKLLPRGPLRLAIFAIRL